VRKEIDESFSVILILVIIGFVVGTAVVGLTIYSDDRADAGVRRS
jgi:hypothetical protein